MSQLDRYLQLERYLQLGRCLELTRSSLPKAVGRGGGGSGWPCGSVAQPHVITPALRGGFVTDAVEHADLKLTHEQAASELG